MVVTELILAPAVAAVEIRLIATIGGDGEPAIEGLITATPGVDEDAAAGIDPLTIPITAPGETRADLREGMAWKVGLAAPGHWCREALVVPTPDHGSVTLKLHPTGTVSGRLAPPGRGKLPLGLDLRARFRSAGSRHRANPELDGIVDCTLAGDRFECEIPGGSVDLRLRATGYVSHYLWNQVVEPRQELEAGTLTLERGASVVGWVETEDATPLRKCRVELAPQLAERPTAADEARSSLLTTGVEVGERGFFHLKGLLPGSYVLTATMEKFAPARIAHLLVRENAEAELRDPVVLRRPLDLAVRLVPSLDPAGGRWSVMLIDTAGGDPVGMGRSDDEGVWVNRETRPSRYYLMVSDSRGARMLMEEIEVDRSQSAFVFELPFVEVEGRVTLGDEPLPATLFFGGISGAVSIEAQADEEGLYRATIPQKDRWAVDVTARDPRVFRRLQGLEISPRPGSSTARLDVELPDTRLAGKVVDENDYPVANARILCMQYPATEMPSYTTSDEDGEFSFRGLAPQTYRLEARASDGSTETASYPLDVELSEQSPTGTVRLVMRRMTQLRGTVLSAGGPVPGARITLQDLQAEGSTGMLMPSTQSASDGSFMLRVPANVTRGDLLIQAPGFVLERRRIAINGDQSLTIALNQEGGGTLLVNLSEPMPTSGFEWSPFFVDHDGVFRYHLTTLLNWARMNGLRPEGPQIEIPLLPAGRYSVCWRRTENETEEDKSEHQCVEGWLPASGVLSIDQGSHS